MRFVTTLLVLITFLAIPGFSVGAQVPDSSLDLGATQVAALVTCSGPDCTTCDFVEMVNEIIQWIIGIMVALAVLLLAVAGVRLVTSGGDTGALEKAKSTFVNVVIGFILVLASWLIVDTILKLMTNTGGLEVWGEVECIGMVEPTETAVDEISQTPNPFAAGRGAGGLSDAEARRQMEAAGIPAKADVSYEGLQPHVISAAATMAAACNCKPLVTSATDGNKHKQGDYSHYNGYKLDLRTHDNPDLVKYVESLQPNGQWKDGTKLYYDPNTCGTYAVEKDHIDVVYKPKCNARI